MSIESKIRYKAFGLYVVVAIAVAATVFLFYRQRKNIDVQKDDIQKQYHSLSLTNELIAAVGDARTTINLYMSSRDKKYINWYSKELVRVNFLIDTLGTIEPLEKKKLQEISALIARQASNISALERRFGEENPMNIISERLKTYNPVSQKEVQVIRVKRDTVIKVVQKKNFFRRLKDVFSPNRDSTTIVSKQHVDSVRMKSADSLAIIGELNQMANQAGKRYEENIQVIKGQVVHLINADKEISTKISALLLELHQRTLNSVLDSITKSEKAIQANYTLSIISGIIALMLILLFIILIIYDVNKGKEAREKIRQVMESRHRLLLSVSHDIKSPLSSIMGYMEQCQQQGEDLKSMRNSARHILSLLDNLLEFSGLEQGNLYITRSGFSLQDICDETGQMFKPLAEAKGLSFSYESDNVRVNSDGMKIKQIIINLLSNAVKYTPEGEISLKLRFCDENILIKVSDTGAGMSQDKLPDLYKPYTRVESNNALASGTGLGMYVVKGLVDLLGGTIQVHSVVGQGTDFEVVIPATEEKLIIPKGSHKVAVYDDDPVMVKLVRDMLIGLGHQVVERDYDIVLTDMEMNGVLGTDILASVRDVPVIVMTGRADFSPERAKELGFAGYLAKPFNREDVRNIFGEGETLEDDFLGDDKEEILEIFRATTVENFQQLREALRLSDFNKAQSICHKMLPMFAQLGYPTEALRRMDLQRGKEYEEWQSDVEKILLIRI